MSEADLLPTQAMPPSVLGGDTPPPKSKKQKKTKLDSEEYLKLLRQLEEWYEVERIRQAPNRYQQAIDDDFYDGLQWSDEDAQELALRGQAPLVYNKVQPAVKWLTGTEKRTKIDYKILPRKDGQVNGAENLTKLMKYVQDVNKAAYARSRAFEDTVKTGLGWLECGVRGDPTMEPVYSRSESWRRMIYDSQGVEFDLSDSRYVYRDKWTDLDIAIALFPNREHQLRSASVYSDFADAQDNEEWYLGQILQERSADGSVLNRRTYIDSSSSLFNRRARVKLHEVWFRKPQTVQYIHSPDSDHHNREYDPTNDGHGKALTLGGASLFGRLGMKMWCAIYIRGCLLQCMPSPYRHNDFPFTPVWGNRRGRDHAPYGIIRVVRDPQEDFNKRMSKALHALSSRRVVVDAGAVEDIEELRLEAARPDSVLVKKAGSELTLVTDMDVAEHHIHYANLDEKAIQDNSGVTDELMGHKTNAISGRAIEKRQDQGSTVTTDFFDNLRLATQLHGQKELSLIGQYYSEKKQIRVLGAKQPEDFITLNDPQPDGSILNDITQTEADFIVDETDYKATQRQAMFETLMELVGELMKVNQNLALMMLDDVMEFSDIPGKEQLVATIRQMTGKPDPDKKLTPQEQQAMQQAAQQKAQEEAEQKALVLAAAKGNVAKIFAQVDELKAKATKLNAEAGGDGGAAASYNDELQKLHDSAEKMREQLTKEILVLERQVGESRMRALDHSDAAAAGIEKQRIATAGSIEVAQINAYAKGAQIAMQGEIDAAQAGDEFVRGEFSAAADRAHTSQESGKDRQFKFADGLAQRSHTSQENQASRTHEATQAEKDRQATAQQTDVQIKAEDKQATADRQLKAKEGQATRQQTSHEAQAERQHKAKQADADRKLAEKTAKAKPKPKK